MFMRGHPDDPAAPYIVDSDNARDFFEDALEIPCFDVVRKMEQWACTRGQSTFTHWFGLKLSRLRRT
jgi:hypothetical protein